MNLNKLEKATKVLVKIKKLDAEILELDKFAMLVADGAVKPKFSMTFDKVKEDEKGSKVNFDEDGSLIPDGTDMYRQIMLKSLMMPSWLAATPEKKKEESKSISQDVSENAALQILGILLGEKQRKREALIQSLTEIGFKI